MEIILEIAATHPQEADVWVGMWPPSLRRALKSRFEKSSNYANTLTNLIEKRLVFFTKALKEVSKILAKTVSELRKEREAKIKLIEQSELAQSKQDQQQWRGTPLPSNQPKIESFWHSLTPPAPTTSLTTGKSQTSRNKAKKYNRLWPKRQKLSTTYKTPVVNAA